MITLEQLREHFHYDENTGHFTRLKGRGQSECPPFDGYISVCFMKFRYRAHRLAWFYTKGVWPSGHIDHINGNRSDNLIINLRDVSKEMNAQNRRNQTAANRNKLLGVYKTTHGKGYGAQIYHEGKNKFLGVFETPELAHAAYVESKRVLHPGCTI